MQRERVCTCSAMIKIYYILFRFVLYFDLYFGFYLHISHIQFVRHVVPQEEISIDSRGLAREVLLLPPAGRELQADLWLAGLAEVLLQRDVGAGGAGQRAEPSAASSYLHDAGFRFANPLGFSDEGPDAEISHRL